MAPYRRCPPAGSIASQTTQHTVSLTHIHKNNKMRSSAVAAVFGLFGLASLSEGVPFRRGSAVVFGLTRGGGYVVCCRSFPFRSESFGSYIVVLYSLFFNLQSMASFVLCVVQRIPRQKVEFIFHRRRVRASRKSHPICY